GAIVLRVGGDCVSCGGVLAYIIGLKIADIDIRVASGAACYEVGGQGRIGYKAAIVAECRPVTVSIALDARIIYTYAFGCTGLPVAHEDIPMTIRVIGHQVRGCRIEDHKAAIVANGGLKAVAIGLDTGAVDTHQFSRASLPVAQVDIGDRTVRVARHESKPR